MDNEKASSTGGQDSVRKVWGMEPKDFIDSIVKLSGFITILLAIIGFAYNAKKDSDTAAISNAQFKETDSLQRENMSVQKKNLARQKSKDSLDHLRDIKLDSASAANIRKADSITASNIRHADSLSFLKMATQFHESIDAINAEKQAALYKEQSSNYIELCIRTINETSVISLNNVNSKEYNFAVANLNGNLLSQHKLLSNSNIVKQLEKVDSVLNGYYRRYFIIGALDSIGQFANNLNNFLNKQTSIPYSARSFKKDKDIQDVFLKYINPQIDSLKFYSNAINSFYKKIDAAIPTDEVDRSLIFRSTEKITKNINSFIAKVTEVYNSGPSVGRPGGGYWSNNISNKEAFYRDYQLFLNGINVQADLDEIAEMKRIYLRDLRTQNLMSLKILHSEIDLLISMLSNSTKERLQQIYVPDKQSR